MFVSELETYGYKVHELPQDVKQWFLIVDPEPKMLLSKLRMSLLYRYIGTFMAWIKGLNDGH
jgi:hypothetical protein